MKEKILQATLDRKHAGKRIDKVLADLFSDFSRAFFQESIRQGRVTADGKTPRPRDRVVGGERVVLSIVHDLPAANGTWRGQALPVNVVHADADLLVVDKAAGQVVHPAPGHGEGTLVNALIHRYPEMVQLPRAGVVHRLDKDTTGLLIVARTHRARQLLIRQLQARQIRREYLCLVHGEVIAGGCIENRIGRHPHERKRMAVVANGRIAITHYRVARRFKGYTLLHVRLETGRTHQVRVHMACIRHPVLGDPVYRMRKLPHSAVPALTHFKRQALHACELALAHPATGRRQVWRSTLPQDMQAVIDALDAV